MALPRFYLHPGDQVDLSNSLSPFDTRIDKLPMDGTATCVLNQPTAETKR